MSNQLQITSIEQIKERVFTLIELPGWTEDVPLVVQVKPVSILGLASKGKLPNSLLSLAAQLFEGKRKKSDDKDVDLTEISKLMDILAAEILVQPNPEELLPLLTDTQKYALFAWTQGGVKALEEFRKK